MPWSKHVRDAVQVCALNPLELTSLARVESSTDLFWGIIAKRSRQPNECWAINTYAWPLAISNRAILQHEMIEMGFVEGAKAQLKNLEELLAKLSRAKETKQ